MIYILVSGHSMASFILEISAIFHSYSHKASTVPLMLFAMVAVPLSLYAPQAVFSLEHFTVVRKLFTKFTKLENPQRRLISLLYVPIWKCTDQKNFMKQNRNKIFAGLRNISGDNNLKPYSTFPNFSTASKTRETSPKEELKDCLKT
jgi:hypothetical protein